MKAYMKHQFIKWFTPLAFLSIFVIGTVCTWGAMYIFMMGLRALFS